MNVTINLGAFDGLMTNVTRQVDEAWRNLRSANEETAEFGAKTAQSYTRSRPGATTGKAGRVASGNMVSRIRHKPVSFSDTLIRSQYGFVDDPDDYMVYQTVTGFRHNRSSAYIAPTFAIRDSIGPTTDFAIRAAKEAA